MKLECKVGRFIFSWTNHFYINWRGRVNVKGSTNRVKNGYVIYLDYDKISIEIIEREIDWLKEEYRLSNIYLFQSSENNHHAICFDIMRAKEWIRFLNDTSADIHFKRIPNSFSTREWILRWGEKRNKPRPSFLKKIESPYSKREQSLAHWMFFKTAYPDAKFKKLRKPDGEKELDIIEYETRA